MNSTRFSEVTPDLEIRLRGLLNLPNAAERHLYELPQIQVIVLVPSSPSSCGTLVGYLLADRRHELSDAESDAALAADVDEAEARSSALPQLCLRVLRAVDPHQRQQVCATCSRLRVTPALERESCIADNLLYEPYMALSWQVICHGSGRAYRPHRQAVWAPDHCPGWWCPVSSPAASQHHAKPGCIVAC